jgi:hypothetical protein
MLRKGKLHYSTCDIRRVTLVTLPVVHCKAWKKKGGRDCDDKRNISEAICEAEFMYHVTKSCGDENFEMNTPALQLEM